MKHIRAIFLTTTLLGVCSALRAAPTVTLISHSTFTVQQATISVPLGRIDTLITGTIISSSGGVVNVRAYGAKCDGVTNDRPAILNAVTAAVAQGNSTVIFPGVCGSTDTIFLPSGIQFAGFGINSSTIIALSGFRQDADLIRTATASGVVYTTSTMASASGLVDLSLDCTNMPTPSGAGLGMGVHVTGTNNFWANRVRVVASQSYGIGIEGTPDGQYIQNPMVTYCIFQNCGRFGTQDSLGGGHHQGSVYQFNTFIAPNGTGIDNVNVSRALWQGNKSIQTAQGSNKGAIWSDYGMTNSRILDNYLENGSIHVFGFLTSQFRGTPSNVHIDGNQIISGGSGAILVSPANQDVSDTGVSTGIIITSNLLQGCTDSCITVLDSSGTIIANNQLYNWDIVNGLNPGIFMAGGTNISLGGNHGATIIGNTGQKGTNAVWYHEGFLPSVAANNNNNFVAGNNFPGGTISISTNNPTSVYTEINNSTYTVSANFLRLINRTNTFAGSNGTDNLTIDSVGRVGLGPNATSPTTAFTVINSTQNGVGVFIGGGPAQYIGEFRAPTSLSADGPGILIGFDPTTGGEGGVIAARTAATGQPITFKTFDGSSWATRNQITKNGGFMFYSKTLAGLAALVPTQVGETYYCSNCTTDTICTSTQTVTASWARVSDRTTPCQ